MQKHADTYSSVTRQAMSIYTSSPMITSLQVACVGVCVVCLCERERACVFRRVRV